MYLIKHLIFKWPCPILNGRFDSCSVFKILKVIKIFVTQILKSLLNTK